MRALSMKAFLCLMLLTAPGIGTAADADVCYSAPNPGMAKPLTSSSTVSCPRAGNHTLPELAEAGWTLVAVQPVINGLANPTRPEAAWMVVIEKK